MTNTTDNEIDGIRAAELEDLALEAVYCRVYTEARTIADTLHACGYKAAADRIGDAIYCHVNDC